MKRARGGARLDVTPERFRRVMRKFPTGVTIVGTAHDGDVRGMTVNSFTSVSLRPLQVLICIAATAGCHGLIGKSGIFSVNVLTDAQRELAADFADHTMAEVHRFAGVPYQIGKTGAPLLEGAAAYLECTVIRSIRSGDHTIFIGQVEAAEVSEGADPLLFVGGGYARIGEPM